MNLTTNSTNKIRKPKVKAVIVKFGLAMFYYFLKKKK